MSIELKIPSVGESITEVEIANWLKAAGDAVQKDQPLVAIETEKAAMELPAPVSGKLTTILKAAGATCKVGDVIGIIEESAESPKSEPPPSKPTPKIEPPKLTATPVAARVLAEHNLKAEDVQPTGIGGRVRKEDVLRHVAETKPAPTPPPSPAPVAVQPGPRGERVVRMSPLRRTIARRLVEAQHTAALLTTFNEIDMSGVQALRHQHQEAFTKKFGVKLGLMSFFVKAAIDALKLVPEINAELRENEIVYRDYHDIGMAVSTERGLVVPVLRDADRFSFADIERAIAEFAERGRAGKLTLAELEGGTFTITNGGVFGSLLSTPIINPPQSGVLGLHTIQDRPIAVAGQVVIRPMMYVALTYDHRVVDGRGAVTFLKRIKEVIENPARLLLEV